MRIYGETAEDYKVKIYNEKLNVSTAIMLPKSDVKVSDDGVDDRFIVGVKESLMKQNEAIKPKIKPLNNIPKVLYLFVFDFNNI